MTEPSTASKSVDASSSTSAKATTLSKKELRMRERATVDVRRFLILLGQLIGLCVVVKGFGVDRAGFFELMVCATLGFAVHYFVPFDWKKIAFSLIGIIGGTYLVSLNGEGGQVDRVLLAVVCVGIAVLMGVGFYVLLRLPIPYVVRALVLTGIGLGLFLIRNQGVLPEPLWQIIGAVFMFRLIIFAYEVKQGKAPETFRDFASYFFILPNFFFVLFPVIDYVTFKKSFYADDIHATAQRGIAWICRGVVQLMLYRLVYNQVQIQAVEVDSFWMLMRYIFPAFWLYMQVSGWFHVIVGMMHLFGYKLPETNNNYFLASSFTDFWRRINIYWKDFMVNLFYYPAYFKLRKRGETTALILATLWVFFATTVLHGYQWYWLHGVFEIAPRDIVFWTVLGVFVLITVLQETRKSGKAKRSPGAERAIKIASTLGVYVTISVLWSIWSAEDLETWWATITYWR